MSTCENCLSVSVFYIMLLRTRKAHLFVLSGKKFLLILREGYVREWPFVFGSCFVPSRMSLLSTLQGGEQSLEEGLRGKMPL